MSTPVAAIPLPLPVLFLLLALFPLATLAANYTSAGLAWPNGPYVPFTSFTSPSSRISSYYTWSPLPVSPSSSYSSPYSNSRHASPVPFRFIPMLWGCNSTYTSPFLAALPDFATYNLTDQKEVLGFNEPNQAGQAECSPAEAAQTWKDVLEPLRAEGYRVGSPAVTSGQGGRQWMEEWWEACEGGCHPDFVAVHWYDIDPSDFMAHLKYYHDTYQKPIWVTEYAVQNFTSSMSSASGWGTQASLIQIQLFMDVTRAFMESVGWVERYFWFGAMYDMQGVNPLNCLYNLDDSRTRTGALSPLGVQYSASNVTVGAQSSQSPALSSSLLGVSGVLGLWAVLGLWVL